MTRIRPTAAQKREIVAAVEDAVTDTAGEIMALREATRLLGARFSDVPGLGAEAERAFINEVLQKLMG